MALRIATRQGPANWRPGALDAALLAAVAAVAIQLIPLSDELRARVSPARAAVAGATFLVKSDAPRSISLDPAATAGALVVGIALLLVFWSARALFSQGGLRTTVRGLAWTGLALAVLTIVQRGTAPRLLMWLWEPPGRDPAPFGPFVNRNFLATWIVLIVPLLVGYMVARVQSHTARPGGPIDATMTWLGGTVFLLMVTLLLTTSRSGLIGLVGALLLLVFLSRLRMDRRHSMWLLASLALAAVAVSVYFLNASALASRFDETMREGLGGRRAIWRESWTIVRDFWASGVGMGGFRRAMLVYQQSPRATFFNNAHSEYLQIIVEGGILLAIPAGVAVTLLAREMVQRLASDRSPVFWIRAGASAGLFGAAVQSVWEIGVQLPANAVLAIILAAVAVHDSGLRSHFGAPRTMR